MSQTQTTDTPTQANDANSRQQIVDGIKNNNNMLVTVSTNPSVDELSAALGLTILLNNLGKRGTAVVSGQIPPAISFLEPDKTFENTTDSLRDFIIALDKEKADHLRYKVDGDVVKIFITPYRTMLSQEDLEFSLGDYNVEMVIALGVKDQEHLDKALDAHSAILHDAVVATLTAGEEVSTLGGITWQDPSASSLCEMLVSLSEALKEDKPLLDEQISTAFLTGIVSATDRFSNSHTSSRVMTMAAQLMATGANQQLIAAKLQEGHEIGPNAKPSGQDQSSGDGTVSLDETNGSGSEGKDNTNQDGTVIAIDHPDVPPAPAATPASSATPPPPQAPPQMPELPPMPPLDATPPPAPEPAAPPTEAPAPPAETAEQALARELAEVVPPTPAAPTPSLGDELTGASAEAEALQQDEGLPPTPDLPKLDFETLPPPPQAPPQMPELPPMPPPLDAPQAPPPDIAAHPEGGYMSQAPSSSATDGMGASDQSDATVDPFAAPLVSPTLPPLQPDPLFAAQQANGPQTAPDVTPLHMPGQIDYEESPIPTDPAAVAAVPDFAALNPTGLASPVAAPTPPEAPSLDSLPPLPPLPDLTAPPPPPPDLTLPPADTQAPSGATPPEQFKIPPVS